MSDKQPNPTPDGKPAGGDPLSGLAGPSIDDLLAEAESLAENLAQQVGVATEDPASRPPPVPPPKEETSTIAPPAAGNSGEAPAAEVETVPGHEDFRTANDDGNTHSLPLEETPVEASPRTHDAATPDANNFADVAGSESHSEPGTVRAAEAEPRPAAHEPVDPTTASPFPPVSGSPVTADDHAVVDEEINAVAASAVTAAEPLSQAATSANPLEPPPAGRPRRILRRLGDGVKAAPRLLASAPGWAIFGLLWLFDLPFAWMSPALKTTVGYIGVATAVMAALAWALVLSGYGGSAR